jgi:4-alpha-glucanotransferase
MVIGEDLGTVPPGFRERLAEARVLSYKVLPFERWDSGMFKAPDAYPRLSVASAGTHDIATIKGAWLGRDVDWRRRLDLYPDEAARDNEARGRLQERVDLLNALAHYHVLGEAEQARLLPQPDEPVFDWALTEASYLYLAETPSLLMLVQAEDVLEELEAPNLPGTIDEHPNWRRRLSATVAALLAEPRLHILAAKLTSKRKLP